MIINHQKNNYNVGNPSTLLDMKKYLQKQIPNLQKRELIIMVTMENNQVLLEEKNYEKIVQQFKSNKDTKLKCFILQHYLENLKFLSDQKQAQIESFLIKQNENLKNKQDSCQTIQIQEKKDSYQQTNKLSHIEQQYSTLGTYKPCDESINQETIKLNNESTNQTIFKSQTFKTSDESFNQQSITLNNELTNETIFQPQDVQANLEQNEKQKNQISQIIIKSLIDDNENQHNNNQRSQMEIQSYIDDNENQRNEIQYRESLMQTFSLNCINCNKGIQEKQFILSCDHVYHENCLKELFKNQIQQLNSILYCEKNCLIRNPYRILNSLDLKIYFFQLLNNQLNSIKNINKGIRNCPNKGCSFFVIIKHNQICESFCPLCLMHVILV
ncbi:unnamed protein product [Paramecium pentaurelia]|uniref:Uncharacterized protein n=1 Tax=Paramecium pentaurelia TaxID=43138 RepID=A0A8S1Y370_9CILI|nr:unnamed protein product [Paramecium pentaurelia]